MLLGATVARHAWTPTPKGLQAAKPVRERERAPALKRAPPSRQPRPHGVEGPLGRDPTGVTNHLACFEKAAEGVLRTLSTATVTQPCRGEGRHLPCTLQGRPAGYFQKARVPGSPGLEASAHMTRG